MRRQHLRMNSTADGCTIRLIADGPYGNTGQLVTLSPSRARQMVADGIAADPNARAVKPVPPAPANPAPAGMGRFSARLFKIREAEAAVKAAEAALAAAEAE